jgi:hypothetical protein
MSLNTSSLRKTGQRTFVFLPFYQILEHQCELVIHRDHLIIIKVPLGLFFSRFSHGAEAFCLRNFCGGVSESLIFCVVTVTILNPSGGQLVITAAIFRIPVITLIAPIRVSKKFPRFPTFQLL